MAKIQLDSSDHIEARYFDPATQGIGDVAGPASSTDGHLALFDGATGKLLKDGGRPAEGDVVGPALVTA